MNLTSLQLRAVAELKARDTKLNIQWETPGFNEQNAFLRDTSPLLAAKCSRRSGKTVACAIKMLKRAHMEKNVDILYIALTRDNAKQAVWNPLKELNDKHKLNAKFNAVDLTCTLPNGSVIKIKGLDAKPSDMDKVLGGKYPLVVIDEAAFFHQDVRKMVYENLEPAIADYDDGQIVLISTVSQILNSLFFDITTGKEGGWAVHEWTASQNPFMEKKILKIMDRTLKTNPDANQLPSFRRMYLNEWVIDTDSFVYEYNTSANDIHILPEFKKETTILAVDFGFKDANAFSVLRWQENDPDLYILDTYKASKMDVTDVADKCKELMATWGCSTIIADSAAAQTIEELKKRHGLPIQGAVKTRKFDHIQLFNDDLGSGRIKVYKPNCKELTDEWQNLIWDEKKKREGKYVEHSACENHVSDATLYGWRACLAFLEEPKEEYETEFDEDFEAAIAEVREKSENPLGEFGIMGNEGLSWGDDF